MTFSSIDVYKYRRKPNRNNLFKTRKEHAKTALAEKHEASLRIEIDGERRKTYAIMQEPKSDFASGKLRFALMLYSSAAWQLFLLFFISVAYAVDTTVYTFIRPRNRPQWVLTLIICLHLFFTFDVIMSIGLKRSHKWRKTLNLVERGNARLICDVLIALPYSMVYLITPSTMVYDFYVLSPLAAVLRFYRVLEYFYERSTQAGKNQWSIFLIQYLVLFVMSVHSYTCIWYMCAFRTYNIQSVQDSWSRSTVLLPTESKFDWYFICAYYSVMMLTTNALGDLYPVTTTERFIGIVAILLGFTITTIVFVGSLTSQFITITTRRSKYVRQLKKIQNHLRLINMDAENTKRIMGYYEDLWYQKSGVFKPKLFSMLPYPMRMEICYDLNAVPLFSSLIFRKLPEPFLRRLSLAMGHQFYLPGDLVYSHNQNKSIMVCITSGVVEFLSDEDDESPMISFSKGTCFGEIALVYNIPARCTVKAATYVECQVLEKTEFIKLMITYPEVFHDIREEIKGRIVRRQFASKKNVQATPLKLNIYGSRRQKKSSIKYLKDKLRYVQGGSDVDTVEKGYLDENCLDLYILSEHVKKKTCMFTCINASFPWILEHDCYLVKFWEIFMLIIVFYVCTIYPYYIGIQRSFPPGFFFYSEIVTTISLILNVMISTVTAVKTKKKYIRTFTKILNYRMNTLGFYLDLIAIIPFEHIVTIHSQNTYYLHSYRDHTFYFCKGVKLILAWRVSSFFDSLERKLFLDPIIVKVAKYFIYVSLLCYLSGVVLYMESCFVNRCSEDSWFAKAMIWENNNHNVAKKTEYPLIASVYFATTLLASACYGDFTPGDQFDMGCVAFLSLFGVLLSGFFVAEFSAVVAHNARTKTAFLEIIMTIDKFMMENNMHPAIKSRIMAFYELQWQYNSGVELTGDHWLQRSVVPSELRKKVLHQARFKALTAIKFFQVKNKAFIHTLTESAKDIILPPGEIVHYGGTVTRELYIIESGYCLINSNDSKTEKIIGPGNHLGLLVMLYGVPAVSTVVTLTHCKLITIGHAAYTSALNLFPNMREHDGLLTAAELKSIEDLVKVRDTNFYLKHHYLPKNEKPENKIKNILEKLFDDSFINVSYAYHRKKMSYSKSFKDFTILNNVARFLLLPIVIKPDGLFLKTWAIFRVSIAYLLCLSIPINIAMAPMGGCFNILIVVLEALCYLDIYLMMHVAFYGPKNQLIYHPYLTAKNYIQRAFIVDVITCFPWYALWKLFVPKHNESHTYDDHLLNSHMFHCILRMINVSQIYRLSVVFWTESIGALKRAYIMSVVQFLLLTVFFLNLYTCILIIMTCRFVKARDEYDLLLRLQFLSLDPPFMNTTFNINGNMICKRGTWIDEAMMVQDDFLSAHEVYLLSFYWAASSFSGASFGDLRAQGTLHMVLTICINLHGVFFFGYVYARIASLKAMADQVLTKFQENLKHLEMFMSRENVPFLLRRAVFDYWKYQWKRTGGWSHQSILGKLHSNLNEDAVLYMYEKTLSEIPLFENVEYSFFRAFAKKLKEQYFQKGYMVMRSNEVVSIMYIIYRGKVDILTESNEIEACMGPGGIFGNIRGSSRCLTMSNIIASRNIDLLCIEGSVFYALLKSYPKVLRNVRNSVETTVKDYVLPTLQNSELYCSFTAEVHLPNSYEQDEDEDDRGYMEIYTDSPDKSICSYGSKSITSAMTLDYVPAPYLLFKPHRWFRSSIIPDTFWMIFIEYLFLTVSYFDFILLTYQMAFLSIPYFFELCLLSDIFGLYKIFLDLHCGYMNRYGDYILCPLKVRKKYFSNVLYRRRDFLANLPISYLALAMDVHAEKLTSLFCYLRTPQLLRITYLFTHKSHTKLNFGSANLFLKLATIAIWASILSHVNACLFYKMSCLTPEQCTKNNWISKPELGLRQNYAAGSYFPIYTTSLWYMLNLLTITGTGDVIARNDLEVIETIVIIVIIKFSTGLLISEMSAMITAHSSSRIAYDYGINELKDGMRDMNLSDHQMCKMWDYVKELWNRQQGRQMPHLIHQLPFRLQCQVMQAVFGSHIRDSIVFRRTDDDFKRMLSMWMRHCVFFPGNYIVQCGDADQCIYFIHRGEVEVLTVHQNLTESIYDILGPEDSFGISQGLFVGVAHHFSFRARTVVDVVYLKLDDWRYLLDFYPKSAKIVQMKVENVYMAI